MLNKFIGKSFENFYLGFLASVGLAFGSLMIFIVLNELLKFFFEIYVGTYVMITFFIFYLLFLIYTYYLLNMKKNISLKNGFLSFTLLFIFGMIYTLIF